MEVKVSTTGQGISGGVPYSRVVREGVESPKNVENKAVNLANTQNTNVVQGSKEDENNKNGLQNGEKEKDKEDVEKVSMALNKFFEESNADLRVAMHDKTGKLMVQFVSQEDKKVIKEFPSKEFLDVMAKIHDFIGTILDKKA